jgi:hypothetical protein
MALTMLLAVTLAHIAFVCSSNGWLPLPTLPTLAFFSISPSSVEKAQMFFLFTATCQVVLWEWITVTTTFGLFFPGLISKLLQASVYQQTLFVAHVALLILSVWLCGRLLYKIADERNSQTSLTVRASIVLSLLFVGLTCLSWWLILCHGKSFPQWFVVGRAVNLLEGLSPIIPILFVLVAYYLWSLNNLNRLSMVVTRVSLSIPTDNASAKELGDMVTELEESIERNIYVSPSVFVVICLTIIACCLVRLTSALRGFEMWFRWWLVTWEFGLLLIIIVAMLYRSWGIWPG